MDAKYCDRCGGLHMQTALKLDNMLDKPILNPELDICRACQDTMQLAWQGGDAVVKMTKKKPSTMEEIEHKDGEKPYKSKGQQPKLKPGALKGIGFRAIVKHLANQKGIGFFEGLELYKKLTPQDKENLVNDYRLNKGLLEIPDPEPEEESEIDGIQRLQQDEAKMKRWKDELKEIEDKESKPCKQCADGRTTNKDGICDDCHMLYPTKKR